MAARNLYSDMTDSSACVTPTYGEVNSTAYPVYLRCKTAVDLEPVEELLLRHTHGRVSVLSGAVVCVKARAGQYRECFVKRTMLSETGDRSQGMRIVLVMDEPVDGIDTVHPRDLSRTPCANVGRAPTCEVPSSHMVRQAFELSEDWLMSSSPTPIYHLIADLCELFRID